MATISELVQAEAEAAEAEDESTPDEEEEAAEAEEHVDPADAPPENAIGEAEIKRAERAIKDQRKRLAGILGDDYVAHDCPLCSSLGFLPEPPPVGTTLEVVAAEDGIALDIRSPGAPPDLVQAKDKAACDWCNAKGQVYSGADNDYARVVPCSKCQGNGWVQVAVLEPAVTIPPVTTTTGGLAPNDSRPGVPDDAWGRPYGHQHYGVPPSMVGG